MSPVTGVWVQHPKVLMKPGASTEGVLHCLTWMYILSNLSSIIQADIPPVPDLRECCMVRDTLIVWNWNSTIQSNNLCWIPGLVLGASGKIFSK